MTKPNYTHLSLIVDRSGSMSSLALEASGGINNLIKEQAALPGKITVTLSQFDDKYTTVFGPIDAADAPSYTLKPRGMTALLDAVGRSINETGAWLRGMRESERPSKVLFIIVTDGGENSSNEFTRAQVKEMVTEQENEWNWEFMYLGADLSAFADAQDMGINTTRYYTRSKGATTNLYAGASFAVASAHTTGGTMDSAMPDNIDSDTVIPSVGGNTSASDSSS